MNDTTTQVKKAAMVRALEASLGVVTTAARVAEVSRETHYRWMREDAEYKAQVDALKDLALDFAESQLHKLIKGGNVAATIFFLKTQGRGRGYIERHDMDVTSGGKPVSAVIALPQEEPPLVDDRAAG